MELRKNTVDFICKKLEAFQQKKLINYEQLKSGSYVIKFPNEPTLGLHPHPLFVDNRQFKELIIWVALNDTNKKNGALQVVPSEYNRYNFKISADDKRNLRKKSRTLVLQKGDAVIFDTNLKHWSDKNQTNEKRIAVITEVKPREAELLFHNLRTEGENHYIDLYEVEPEFTMHYEKHKNYVKTRKPTKSFLWKKKEKSGFKESAKKKIKRLFQQIKYLTSINSVFFL